MHSKFHAVTFVSKLEGRGVWGSEATRNKEPRALSDWSKYFPVSLCVNAIQKN